MRLATNICLLLIINVAQAQSIRGVNLTNHIHNKNIKTVQFYATAGTANDPLLSPVLVLKGNNQVMLEFDELYQDAFYYQAKLVHCNSDWSKSTLSDLEFMEGYNEFPISDYEYSFGTTVPYVHYKFLVPRPKISGNYVLVVYHENDPENIILTRRFMVFDQKVEFSDKNNIMNRNTGQSSKQQLSFEIQYKNLEIINPQQSVKVNILQNQRWDNAVINLAPSFSREAQKQLDYRYFNKEMTFTASNEFRYFDLRSIKYFGENVETVRQGNGQYNAIIMQDIPRSSLVYRHSKDINGKYMITNAERKVAHIENDYAMVHFTLKSAKHEKDVYIAGALSNWKFEKANLLKYDKGTNMYMGSLFLKQGWYDYQYLLEPSQIERNKVEGDFEITQNQYEVFVYYRPLNLRADLLIGYFTIDFNSRF